jgi:hypothetical protein
VTQILLVADEPGFRDRLGLALERLELSGEEVSFLEAANGNDALVLAEAHYPDLVVADVSVILVLDRYQDEWLGRWSGADALVYRPVDPFALAQVASRLLEEEQGEATLEEATS